MKKQARCSAVKIAVFKAYVFSQPLDLVLGLDNPVAAFDFIKVNSCAFLRNDVNLAELALAALDDNMLRNRVIFVPDLIAQFPDKPVVLAKFYV
ncbi:hypothetical protein J4227_01285 [Candidatus Woesearchaeota archaeon]|nr:hypothetical protein [Candidatus Woesearchaeota archaeon]